MKRFMADFTESGNRPATTSRNYNERNRWPINYIAEVPASNFEDARRKLFDAVKSTNPGAYPFLRSAILRKEDYQANKNKPPKELRKAGVEFG